MAWGCVALLSVFILALAMLAWEFANSLRIKNKFNASAQERGSAVNPMDVAFTDKRILLNDFVLPSFPVIQGKTFVNCDIVGPAVIYFSITTSAQPIRQPRIDAVWVPSNARPTNLANVFYFDQCSFRNCSFQRVIMLVDVTRQDWKDNPHLNWISTPPVQATAQIASTPAVTAAANKPE